MRKLGDAIQAQGHTVYKNDLIQRVPFCVSVLRSNMSSARLLVKRKCNHIVGEMNGYRLCMGVNFQFLDN